MLDLDSIQNTFKFFEFDLVINFAGRFSPLDKIGEDLNRLSSSNLVSVLKSIGKPTTLMHLSSALERDDSLAESDYALSKTSGTRNLLDAASDSNIGVIVVKCHNIIGKDHDHRKLVGTLINQASLGLPISLNYPNRVRDFVYIDDFTEALWHIVEHFEFLIKKNRKTAEYETIRQIDWEIGTGIGTKISDLAFEIYQRLGQSKDLVDYALSDTGNDPFEVCIADTSNNRTIRCTTSLDSVLDNAIGVQF